MLVYANHLTILGKGADGAFSDALERWLPQQLGALPAPKSLRRGGDHHGTRERGGMKSHLRIYAEATAQPQQFSWQLRHPDGTVPDRQWVTEIGLELREDVAQVSCAVGTDDLSISVGAKAVFASCPRFVRYLAQNVSRASDANFDAAVPGERLQEAQSRDDFEGLRHEIQRNGRDFPIVLISPLGEGADLVDAVGLQENLVGLAQVVRLRHGFNGATARPTRKASASRAPSQSASSSQASPTMIPTRHPGGAPGVGLQRQRNTARSEPLQPRAMAASPGPSRVGTRIPSVRYPRPGSGPLGAMPRPGRRLCQATGLTAAAGGGASRGQGKTRRAGGGLAPDCASDHMWLRWGYDERRRAGIEEPVERLPAPCACGRAGRHHRPRQGDC